MRPSLGMILKRLLVGETPARIYMNNRLMQETLRGSVVDIGGGHNPNYFSYLKHADGVVVTAHDSSIDGIDFEKDPLPYASGSIDTVLLFNILEHVYNYRFLVSEARRIVKDDGVVMGFVPFWVGYHPDPHDYFRYTSESLGRIFTEAGFSNIRVEFVGGGPFLANFNTIALSLPRWLRPIAAIPAWYLDQLFISLRPNSVTRCPYGFFFKLQIA